jgi:hypothetical protein
MRSTPLDRDPARAAPPPPPSPLTTHGRWAGPSPRHRDAPLGRRIAYSRGPHRAPTLVRRLVTNVAPVWSAWIPVWSALSPVEIGGKYSFRARLWRTQLGPCGCCHGVRTRRLPARPVRVDERASRRGCTSCVRSACLPGVVRCKRGAHRQRRVAAAHRARRNSRWTSKLPLDRSPFQGIGRARKPWTTGGAFTAVFGSVVMTAISVPAALRGVPGVS